METTTQCRDIQCSFTKASGLILLGTGTCGLSFTPPAFCPPLYSWSAWLDSVRTYYLLWRLSISVTPGNVANYVLTWQFACYSQTVSCCSLLYSNTMYGALCRRDCCFHPRLSC